MECFTHIRSVHGVGVYERLGLIYVQGRLGRVEPPREGDVYLWNNNIFQLISREGWFSCYNTKGDMLLIFFRRSFEDFWPVRLHERSKTYLQHLIVIQRFFKRVYWAARKLALAMALHHRLGRQAPIGALGEDGLSLVVIAAHKRSA